MAVKHFSPIRQIKLGQRIEYNYQSEKEEAYEWTIQHWTPTARKIYHFHPELIQKHIEENSNVFKICIPENDALYCRECSTQVPEHVQQLAFL